MYSKIHWFSKSHWGMWCWIPSMILYLWTIYLNISFSSSLCYSCPCRCLLFPARFRLLQHLLSRGCAGGLGSLRIPCSVAWKVLWRGICSKEVKNKGLLELIRSTPCSPEKANGLPHVLFSQVAKSCLLSWVLLCKQRSAWALPVFVSSMHSWNRNS